MPDRHAFDETVAEILVLHDCPHPENAPKVRATGGDRRVKLYEIQQDADKLDQYRLLNTRPTPQMLHTDEARGLLGSAQGLVSRTVSMKPVVVARAFAQNAVLLAVEKAQQYREATQCPGASRRSARQNSWRRKKQNTDSVFPADGTDDDTEAQDMGAYDPGRMYKYRAGGTQPPHARGFYRIRDGQG